jgi:hypothetical protein
MYWKFSWIIKYNNSTLNPLRRFLGFKKHLSIKYTKHYIIYNNKIIIIATLPNNNILIKHSLRSYQKWQNILQKNSLYLFIFLRICEIIEECCNEFVFFILFSNKRKLKRQDVEIFNQGSFKNYYFILFVTIERMLCFKNI